MAATKKKAVGRPSKYRPEFAEMARKLCETMNATDIQLAKFFEVDERTITNWKDQHPEFFLSLKRGKEIADEQVEATLFQRAVGYEVDEAKVFCYEGKIVETAVKKHIVPDVTAQIFWLKNRKPQDWRDRMDLTLPPDTVLNLTFGEYQPPAKKKK